MGYKLLLGFSGALMLALAAMPLILRRLPLSLPIVLVLLGVVLGLLPIPGQAPDPRAHPLIVERLAELIVLISLMGTGLKIDTAFGWQRWTLTWRLLAITMPLSILGIAVLGWGVLGLSLPAALLLGAALAPTDPVLASDVQVGPPGEDEEEDQVRFALTSEAGLNDSLAFPFVNLAIAWAAYGATGPGIWLLEWFAVDVLWKLTAGVGLGWLIGRFAAKLLFRVPESVQLAKAGDGFVSVGVTLLAYGVTELVHGYGFLAVFCAALTIRAAERQHSYHEQLHEFAEEIERLAMALLLILLGASLVSGLLWPLSLPIVATALIALLLVRPLAGMVGLLAAPESWRERLAISFFGIRGMGSVYYLAYAVTHGDFLEAESQILWTTTALIITLSILIHGTTATPVMRRFGPPEAKADS